MSQRQNHRTAHIVLSDLPERQQLRSLQSALNERRDQIAELDLEIETLRDRLAAFEALTQARLAEEHDALRRIDSLTRHIERWVQLLAREDRRSVERRAQRIDARRTRELDARPARDNPAAKQIIDEVASLPEPSDRLKSAYRELARRFHPDLARTEEERLQYGQTMARINELYRLGDLERLEAMAEQAKGGELEDVELDTDEQLTVLEKRLAWFDAVLQNLRDERTDLEKSSTCQLMRNVAQAEAIGRDLIVDLKEELRERVEKTYANIPTAIRILEVEVQRYNREKTVPSALSRRAQNSALERHFDPFADKRLMRLSLETLATCRVEGAAREQAAWIEEEGPSQPAILRLLLLSYVSELSPFPLAGLETYDDLNLRYDYLAANDDPFISLSQALIQADDMVEYGVRRATERVAHTGLRFRNEVTRDAVTVALRALSIRRELKRILQVLGELTRCPSCGNQAFAIPLYRTRGLDDLRANVCPLCGHTLASYWMPKGQDVQAVLNTAYLDFEIISEYSFLLARSSVAMQLLPVQVEQSTVGDLKLRLFNDLFNRYDLGLKRRHVRLRQGSRDVPEKTPLEDLETNQFAIRLVRDAPMTVTDALELLRHRIRNRFKAD